MLNQNLPASAGLTVSADAPAMPVLLVDPEPGLRDLRYLLLSTLRIPVHAVGSYAEVFQLSGPDCYNLVVLCIRPNEKQASYVAEYVRRRWPKAKVLLLGKSSGCIDDPLYDDIVDPYCNPSGFVEATKRLLEWVRTGRMQ